MQCTKASVSILRQHWTACDKPGTREPRRDCFFDLLPPHWSQKRERRTARSSSSRSWLPATPYPIGAAGGALACHTVRPHPDAARARVETRRQRRPWRTPQLDSVLLDGLGSCDATVFLALERAQVKELVPTAGFIQHPISRVPAHRRPRRGHHRQRGPRAGRRPCTPRLSWSEEYEGVRRASAWHRATSG